MKNIYVNMIEIKNWKFEIEYCIVCINIFFYGILFYNSFNDKIR